MAKKKKESRRKDVYDIIVDRDPVNGLRGRGRVDYRYDDDGNEHKAGWNSRKAAKEYADTFDGGPGSSPFKTRIVKRRSSRVML